MFIFIRLNDYNNNINISIIFSQVEKYWGVKYFKHEIFVNNEVEQGEKRRWKFATFYLRYLQT